jgi:predicted phosphodiesterase
MRIAIVSDVHGNLHALDAVIADLKRHSPDLIVHGAVGEARLREWRHEPSPNLPNSRDKLRTLADL